MKKKEYLRPAMMQLSVANSCCLLEASVNNNDQGGGSAGQGNNDGSVDDGKGFDFDGDEHPW